jgi:hypothetical protein
MNNGSFTRDAHAHLMVHCSRCFLFPQFLLSHCSILTISQDFKVFIYPMYQDSVAPCRSEVGSQSLLVWQGIYGANKLSHKWQLVALSSLHGKMNANEVQLCAHVHANHNRRWLMQCALLEMWRFQIILIVNLLKLHTKDGPNQQLIKSSC